MRIFVIVRVVTLAVALVSFPTAFYLVAGYTESTFLAFMVGTWLAARNRRWWLVAVLAVCTLLTRMQGTLLCLPIAWMAFRETPVHRSLYTSRRGFRLEITSRIAAVSAAPLIVVIYTLIKG